MLSMTATELRDRLDDRFRLLVGSRRGLERHQTLRHAVQWSYDLLDDAEKTLLARCSVFAGGFDLAAACAVAGSDDELATLDLLDALVRKSLLVADRSSGRTRSRCWRPSANSPKNNSSATGEADDAAPRTPGISRGGKPTCSTLWDSPRQREAYDWFAVELANLRAAFRWAADQGDLDTAAAIAVYARSSVLGRAVRAGRRGPRNSSNLRRPSNTRGWPSSTSGRAVCYMTGRVDDFLRYIEAGQQAIESGTFDEFPSSSRPMLGGGYLTAGQPERWVEWCRNVIARDPGVMATSLSHASSWR